MVQNADIKHAIKLKWHLFSKVYGDKVKHDKVNGTCTPPLITLAIAVVKKAGVWASDVY